MANTLQPVITFYSSWFCPYAQRTWIALNQLNVKYEWVEALKFNENHEYVKSEELLRINPKGLVPTLDVDREIIVESIFTIEYLYKRFGDDKNIVTDDLVQDASEANKNICSSYFRMMLKQEEDEQEAAWKEYVDGLRRFTESVHPNGFYKSDTMNIVDITVFPWSHRLDIIERFRERKLDQGLPWVPIFFAWFERMLSFKAVQDTMPNKEELMKISSRYAKGTAKSKVADAVRAGKEAHDLD